MILTDLQGAEVRGPDGDRVGEVVDVRFVIDGAPGQLLAGARLAGLLVSPRGRSSFLGYERGDARGPWPLSALLRRRARGSFLVPWEDVAVVRRGVVELRADYRRESVLLPDASR